MAKCALVWAIVCLLGVSSAAGKYSGGTGEPNDPYRIATAEDLNDIGNHVEDFNKCFVMVNDINLADLSGANFRVIGEVNEMDEYFGGGIIGTPFTGRFDGNGFSVCNLTIQVPGEDFVGMFAYIDDVNAGVWNLSLIDPNVLGAGYVGVLVSVFDRGKVYNCNIQNGVVSGFDSYAGGLAARNVRGSFSDCSFSGNVSGAGNVGGLIGYSSTSEGTINSCRTDGTVTGTGLHIGGLMGGGGAGINRCSTATDIEGAGKVGGLVGDYYGGEIKDSSAASEIFSAGDCTGGLVGVCQDSHIRRCFATGNVVGNTRSGGLIGQVRDDISTYSSVAECYATGDVNGNTAWRVGGLIGDCEAGVWNTYAIGRVQGGSNYVGGLIGIGWTVVDSFWDVETSGQTSSEGGTGTSTAEMRMPSTFTDAGWDFVEVWDIGEGQTYPFLRKYLAGDSNHDGVVDWQDFSILASRWLEGTE